MYKDIKISNDIHYENPLSLELYAFSIFKKTN